jgi:Recombinase
MDPDLHVWEAFQLVSARFAELQSVRQVHLSLRNESIALPAIAHSRPPGRSIDWKLPVHNTMHHMLTNPIYAGAYAFGRTESRTTIKRGRKRVTRGFRRDRSDWEVLLVDHHDGYVSWADFERNQRLIADNATSKGMPPRGALRKGELLLGGPLRCGHCGRQLHVAYSAATAIPVDTSTAARISIMGRSVASGSGRCASTRRSASKRSSDSNRSASRRRIERPRLRLCRWARSGDRSNWRWSRRATRLRMRSDNTTQSTPAHLVVAGELGTALERGARDCSRTRGRT